MSDQIVVNSRYQTATAAKYSTGLNVCEYPISAFPHSSTTPMKNSSEVVLSMLLNSFPSGGTMTLAACGRTIRRIASPCVMPSDRAASS